MRLILSLFLAFAIHTTANAEQHEGDSTATFDRTTLMVADMEASFAFWRDVMGYTVRFEPVDLPQGENKYLGWSAAAAVQFARLQSDNGAGIGLLGVTQADFPKHNMVDHPTAYGGVVLVHPVTGIDAIYARAIEADAVLKPLGLSPSGRSKQMFLKSPSGHVLEVYELLPDSTK